MHWIYAAAIALAGSILVGIVFSVLDYRRRLKESSPRLGTWRFSGVIQGNNNALSEAGCIKVPTLMTEMEALAMLPTLIPRAVVIHVDSDNFIITYKIAQ